MSRGEHGITRPGEPARIPTAGKRCGDYAGPDWCDRHVFSRDLCRPHYRRLARGGPLTHPDECAPGSPSGHGTYGTVTERNGRLVCHDCGRTYRSLAVHIGMTHGDVRDYKRRHGLLMSTSLLAPTLADVMRSASERRDAAAIVLRTSRRSDVLAPAQPADATRAVPPPRRTPHLTRRRPPHPGP